ncbi:basic proline-rich protein-like [Schistocerca nitens]|uniref:basic proline-rich protein-like n=1 Tax=Schistocerca nitens TaxID=7011 RepID=UPI0021194A86|nr:basic proline-rich protein-like [Schistocerca nitens]
MATQRALADGKSEALRPGNVRVAIIRSYTPLALQSAALVAVAGMSPYTECQSRDGGAVPASRPQRTPSPPPLPVPSFRAEGSLGDPPGSHISATPPTSTPTPRPHPPGAAPIVCGGPPPPFSLLPRASVGTTCRPPALLANPGTASNI